MLEEQKRDVELYFTAAEAVASRIGYIFADKKDREKVKVLQPWHAYPTLFEKERAEEEQTNKVVALENYKSDFAKYAERWNKRKGNAEKSI